MSGPDDAARTSLRVAPDEPASRGTHERVPAVSAWQTAADTGHQIRVSGNDRAADSMSDAPVARTVIPGSLLQAIIDWSVAGLPNEACGLLAAPGLASDGAMPDRFLPLTNVAASPYRYLIDPDQQLRAVLDIEDAGGEVWGIVHSHVASPAVPSDTDVGLAGWPDALYLICSLASTPPVVRAWSVRDGQVTEVGLVTRGSSDVGLPSGGM